MYVQVLLIKRCTVGLSCQSDINQGAAQRLESEVTKFSQTSTSETQSKWLVQKISGEGRCLVSFFPITASVTQKRNIVLLHKCIA